VVARGTGLDTARKHLLDRVGRAHPPARLGVACASTCSARRGVRKHLLGWVGGVHEGLLGSVKQARPHFELTLCATSS
jgi:hypothetical protein